MKSPVACFLVLSVALSLTARGDQVILFNGQAVTGKVLGEHLELATATGQVSIPFASITRLITKGEAGAKIELVDATALEGRLLADSISVHQGLYDRVIPVREISSIEWAPATVHVPAGTSISLELIRTLSSASSQAGNSVAFCVAGPVVIDGKTVISKHAPAWGQVLGAGGGRNAEGGGKLGLEATGVAAVDGTELPLKGRYQAEGGFDGGAIAAGGVFGLMQEGKPAQASHGTLVEAQTTTDADVTPAAKAASSQRAALARACEDYFSLAAFDYIPAERLGGGKVFAPVPQPMRISVPIARVLQAQDGAQNAVRLDSLIMEDISIPVMIMEVDHHRKGDATLAITANIYVRPSHDRWVNLEYQLVAGDRTVATMDQPRIDAEEGKVKVQKTKFQLTLDQLAALSSTPDPRLRITMTAIEN